MAKVDVIVPCYKYGHFLRQCVESVLDQSIRDARVLVIDDASPDATAEVAAQLVREDSRVVFSRHAVNRGHIATYNEGIEWASADYLLLLSADDFLLPGALVCATRFLDAHEEVGLVHGACLDDETAPFSGASGAARDNLWHVSSGRDFLAMISSTAVNPVETPTAIVRTRLQKKIGGYLPELPHSGDLEMWMRFAAHASIARVDAALAVRRLHGQNMSRGYYETVGRDYFQRKAAFDSFFSKFTDRIPDGRHLHAQTYRTLAEQMFWTGVGQFCRGNRDMSRQLLGLAVDLCPDFWFWPPVKHLWRMPSLGRKLRYAITALAVGARRARTP
jgi:glycosyltransferase involved in cell wall biosynthesis